LTWLSHLKTAQRTANRLFWLASFSRNRDPSHMLEPARHVPLRPLPWNPSEVSTAIEDAVSDALAHFGGERFWPAHPLDGGVPDGQTSFYFGATGVIWALEYLRRVGATKAPF